MLETTVRGSGGRCSSHAGGHDADQYTRRAVTDKLAWQWVAALACLLLAVPMPGVAGVAENISQQTNEELTQAGSKAGDALGQKPGARRQAELRLPADPALGSDDGHRRHLGGARCCTTPTTARARGSLAWARWPPPTAAVRSAPDSKPVSPEDKVRLLAGFRQGRPQFEVLRHR